MKKIQMSVRGQLRNVYLEKYLGDSKWSARTYVGPRSRTTVSGIYSVNSLGAKRFTPQGVNAGLV